MYVMLLDNKYLLESDVRCYKVSYLGVKQPKEDLPADDDSSNNVISRGEVEYYKQRTAYFLSVAGCIQWIYQQELLNNKCKTLDGYFKLAEKVNKEMSELVKYVHEKVKLNIDEQEVQPETKKKKDTSGKATTANKTTKKTTKKK